MVDLSHGYPYFIQLLGEAAWEEMVRPDGHRELTPDGFVRAAARFEHRKRDYYRKRYRELEKDGLLPAGRAVAEAFRRKPLLDTAGLCAAIGGTSPGRKSAEVDRALRALIHLGFLWETSPNPGWEPGIPSLLDYLREHAPAP